jgi:hypothetical protein
VLQKKAGYATRSEGNMDVKVYTSILEGELQQEMEYHNEKPEDVIL